MSLPCAYASGRPRRAASARVEPESDGEAPRTPKRTRTSRALHRKTDHSVIERRRREKINDRLVCLQNTVPACRDKARECLMKKASATPMEADEISARIASDMVLEKLCIISHTVDYVMELRAKLKAYEVQCSCDPKLPVTLRDDEAHCLETHPEKSQCERTSPSSHTSSEIKSEETCAAPDPDAEADADLCDDPACDVPDLTPPPTEPLPLPHHHHHDTWMRPYRPWVPWHARSCHMHMCYEPPMYAPAPPAYVPRESGHWCPGPAPPPPPPSRAYAAWDRRHHTSAHGADRHRAAPRHMHHPRVYERHAHRPMPPHQPHDRDMAPLM
ncbi:hypothetical protein MEQU1_003664 [Malassezia equina]|uniref:BHLH domain-containing protein n=1 Tax=Malassezia equina TaxID=1381935 RepID=A0AAF0EEN5_9BASI|nr:hypothetical protein MEQU1_003664 [Malassezia equina]